ncbi:MAG: hypothetical protein Q7J35_05500 [Candidatus Methanoperedens sp.]|nr:hypothetical protein [Candidatus Methanoperedens sp.]
MFSFSTLYAIFAVMVVVLPVPAPARIVGGLGCAGWLQAGEVLGLIGSNLM